MSEKPFPLLRSLLLSQFPNVGFAMSTREGNGSSPFGFNVGFHTNDKEKNVEENLSRFFSALSLSPDEAAFMEQVHEAHVIEAGEPGVHEGVDALVTRTEQLALAVRTADCAPVILCAPADGVVAAVHAGWKGSAERVSQKTVAYLAEEYGIEPAYLFAYIGPCAKSCCYEVSEEIADRFPPDTVDRAAKKPRLDLQRVNVLQLIDAGLKEENIEAEDSCSICNPLFHSHRRDGENAGRMLAAVYLKKGAT